MKIEMQLGEIKQIEATVTITATIEEFREMQSALTQKYPGWKVSRAIATIIEQADKTFAQKVTEE